MKIGLGKKIWLCIGILVVGYAFSVTRNLMAEREVRARLTKIRLGLLPAKQESQAALDAFNRLSDEYQAAVTFGERERLEATELEMQQLMQALARLETNPYLDADVRQQAIAFVSRVERYNSSAAVTYARLLETTSLGDDNIPLKDLRDLITESQQIAADLNSWNQARENALTENITMISTRMSRETSLNMAVLIVVTIVSGSIAYVIISKKIIGPINNTVRLAQQISAGKYDNRLAVQGEDEVSHLGRAFNRMTEKLEETLRGLEAEVQVRRIAEEKLKLLNEQLEQRVSERTDALSKANTHLNHSLEELKTTQQQLVEVEKMASLGELVAGVAHEINTPVGIGVTVASHLRRKCDELMHDYENGCLRKSKLDEFVSMANEGVGMLLENLQRAAGLIQSFKQVAVDQSSDDRRRIDVVDYVKEVVASLQPKLKRTKYRVSITGVPHCQATTFPGALAQIITNLVNNSIMHGFDGVDRGTITIGFSEPDEENVEIRYSDDGIGMESDALERIFNPFFTTKRSQGGSGLGMHIIYNLVTQSLKGVITCTSAPDDGFCAVITFPKTVTEDTGVVMPEMPINPEDKFSLND